MALVNNLVPAHHLSAGCYSGDNIQSPARAGATYSLQATTNSFEVTTSTKHPSACQLPPSTPKSSKRKAEPSAPDTPKDTLFVPTASRHKSPRLALVVQATTSTRLASAVPSAVSGFQSSNRSVKQIASPFAKQHSEVNGTKATAASQQPEGQRFFPATPTNALADHQQAFGATQPTCLNACKRSLFPSANNGSLNSQACEPDCKVSASTLGAYITDADDAASEDSHTSALTDAEPEHSYGIAPGNQQDNLPVDLDSPALMVELWEHVLECEAPMPSLFWGGAYQTVQQGVTHKQLFATDDDVLSKNCSALTYSLEEDTEYTDEQKAQLKEVPEELRLRQLMVWTKMKAGCVQWPGGPIFQSTEGDYLSWKAGAWGQQYPLMDKFWKTRVGRL